MNWYWFSFSLKGKNQGCCNVQAKTKDLALQKTIDLGIHPKHDDMAIVRMTEPELTPDKLYTKKELIAKEYEAMPYNFSNCSGD